MKRNNETVREIHRKKAKKHSRYGAKLAGGKQMYGPGCCAHDVPQHKIEAAKDRARKEGFVRLKYEEA